MEAVKNMLVKFVGDYHCLHHHEAEIFYEDKAVKRVHEMIGKHRIVTLLLATIQPPPNPFQLLRPHHRLPSSTNPA